MNDASSLLEPSTRGVHHVGLTVPRLEPTLRFFVEVLGMSPVGERPEYPAVFVSDGVVLLTLWQARGPERPRPFDRRRNVGLHHLALRVVDHAALDALHERLEAEPDVEVEFGPEALGGSDLRHMMCIVPGGIRLELVATAAGAAR